MAVEAIRMHKLRALLTTLGIVIGIVSVTAMLTTINGIEYGFDRSMSLLGTNVLHVEKWPWGDNSGRWWEYVNRPDITEELVTPIQRRSEMAEAVAPVARRNSSVQYQDRSVSGVFLQASTPAFTRISEINLTAGRYYTQFDYQTARNVCVIGAEVAEQLFPVSTPVGKSVRIDGHRFDVVGVLERQGSFLGMMSFDNQVQLPFSTFEKLFGTRNRSLDIQVKVASETQLDRAEDELTGIVRVARGLSARQENNFAINRQEAIRQQFATVKLVVYGVGLFLTALSLLVGGIGVMNIMFVSIKERTREIGIRKAVGAQYYSILAQFLTESVLITLLGGAIGIGISVGITEVINEYFTARMSLGTVGLAFGICGAVGIIFGFIPARSAALSDPVEALRYE